MKEKEAQKERNKMKWFNNPKTLEELKKQYKQLAMKHHPDLGGSDADMKEINAEYDKLFELLKNVHQSASGETYTAREETTETPEQFRDIVNRLITLDGIVIEVCGSWLWVSGDTKQHRETLKELHFRWSKNKSAWYFHDEGYHKRGKKSFTMDEIRDMWGSERIVANRGDRLKAATV